MALLQRFSFILLFATLIGCGGSSGGFDENPDGGDGSTPDAITITLAISNTTVTGAEPVTVTATVMQGATAVVGRAVTFTTGLGAFSPASGSALTDENGVATITLTAGSVRGASEISATLSTGESSTTPLGFTTQGDDIGVVGDININVALVDAQGNSTNTVTSSRPGKAIATINGISAPVIVTFTSTIADIPIATTITDENNQASVDVFAGEALGAGTITASIESGESNKTNVVIGSSSVTMGSGTPFESGVAEISLAEISAGGTSVISVSIIDDQGNLFNEPIEVNFSSGCAAQSTATLSSPVTTSNGVATSTYLAQGCVGDDPINVTANAGGINLSATTSINVLAADIGSIEFVTATPEHIGLVGTGIVGGSESSTVVFKVKDTDGNPYNNRVVNFALNTNVGGISLSQDVATSNAQGIVQTVVNSGTVATTVRVTASTEALNGTIVYSESSILVVSTGLPDQDSFSLARGIANPEAWNVDGVAVPVTVRMADAFNNTVPDGTAVYFTTEGGAIESSCTTIEGACSVNWTSQNPRPAGQLLTNSFCSLADDADPDIFCARPPLANGKNYLGQKYGGRVTILATAIGQESFPDKNGNGRFDESEYTLFLGGDVGNRPYDLKEAFVDHNEDGFYNPEEAGAGTEVGGELEEFADFNNNGTFDLQDGTYNGVLCGFNDVTNPGTETPNQYCANPDDEPDPTKKSEKVSTNVRGSTVIIMSGTTPYITVTATNDAVASGSANLNPDDTTLYIAGESTGTVSIVIADLHNQPMPAGTKVTFVATVGSIPGTNSYVWPGDSSNGGSQFSVAVKGEAEPTSGPLEIKVETPGGVTTVYSGINIVIQ
ncbi:hypothetical protein SAMN05216262_101148 [Colwellia chukchiensis]|uniref:Big-1 domain-containing protein n=1 Tax=Colwellia chukchiensis TaxID=641665 RepID=A0A1H7GBP6_9GAMM|nr:hypothetical protein [Colwellia chukchiensis]SEK35538.1 hypothetical protein SAMN05216262_101148 [Colwellia chukchiensis]